jgi:DNA-binding transcriptional ArsR family regulator
MHLRAMSSPELRRVHAEAAPVFAALGDSTRLALVYRLIDGQPRSIIQLGDGLSLTRQGVTKHLRVLERAGILTSKSVGRESLFVYVPETVERARSYLESVSAQWDEALLRLKTFVEYDERQTKKRVRRRAASRRRAPAP